MINGTKDDVNLTGLSDEIQKLQNEIDNSEVIQKKLKLDDKIQHVNIKGQIDNKTHIYKTKLKYFGLKKTQAL